VAEHEHGAVWGIRDRGMRDPVSFELLQPRVELASVRDAERQMVESRAPFVEQRAVALVVRIEADAVGKPGVSQDHHLAIRSVLPCDCREAEYVGVERQASFDIGHGQIDVRDTGDLGHRHIQSPTCFSYRACVYSSTVTSPTRAYPARS